MEDAGHLPVLRGEVLELLAPADSSRMVDCTVGLGGHAEALTLRPSTETRLDHGFSAVTSFFPGTKVLAAELMEAIASAVTEQDTTHAPLIFDDQYISTGGQLYELCAGRDRFLCDLRPLLYELAGKPRRHCCHPYDICTMLIAEEEPVVLPVPPGRLSTTLIKMLSTAPLDRARDLGRLARWTT